MKKLVPDPPTSLYPTLDKPFGDCTAGHPQLFSVNAGIAPHDALVHTSLYLRCAYDTAHKAFDGIDDSAKGFLWSTLHSVEMAKGLIEALLDALEDRQVTQG
ncbi:DUF3077 domain-containing protein [Pseudomonas sp. GD03860]|uniref:DUF3077 domain-containing protein n=1 Tax=Pseudomonas TaxID=286 RepID=UPI0023641CE4|nr:MULTISPECIES: DUF3077 domain-containing protein [Pseudomonas]MDD2056373.1 DUF3077 domain-containing protein [Pseudomonas putida]MDH0638929.1 DUF3077 domain-containing protein [Pseudomonas sp. GD03860]